MHSYLADVKIRLQSSQGPVCEGADSIQDGVISIKKNHYIKV